MTKPAASRAVTGEVINPAPPARRAPVRLDTADSIRLEMARVYRDARSRKLDSQEASRLVYMLGELRKCHETTVIERRLKSLEEEHEGNTRKA